MSYDLSPFASIPLSETLLEHLIAEHRMERTPRLKRLWRYYRNQLAPPDARGGSQHGPAQRAGLPFRLAQDEDGTADDRARREIVIENDIAWRVNTLVDFMFPTAPRLVSKAADADQRADIELILNAVIEANGGVELWQDAALLSSIYGFVDFMVTCRGLERAARRRDAGASGAVPSKPDMRERAHEFASQIAIETVEAPRAIPVLSRSDYRRLDAYILHFEQPTNDVASRGASARFAQRILGGGAKPRRKTITVTEIHSDRFSQRYEDGRLVEQRSNELGRLPVTHIQNLSQPYFFEGVSDVEALIPLQDELNTRLSDRANRVTMQSFRMWLGKGVDGFTERPVGPGQMWMTENLDASIESFGGDADSPSERAHIEELREAMDKASGVTPAAAGHVRARVGNLTSENALRVTLMGTIAKTKRKRVTFEAGIRQLCGLILHALDVYGVHRTTPRQRQVDVVWADPLPPDETRRINDALAKAQLGVPLEVLRTELGYSDTERADR
jgi:hypothetical protein